MTILNEINPLKFGKAHGTIDQLIFGILLIDGKCVKPFGVRERRQDSRDGMPAGHGESRA